MKRHAAQGERAILRLDAIRASVAALGDEDLLDLADIFAAAETPLKDMASDEMQKRNISL